MRQFFVCGDKSDADGRQEEHGGEFEQARPEGECGGTDIARFRETQEAEQCVGRKQHGCGDCHRF